jgi:hypothetical protein
MEDTAIPNEIQHLITTQSQALMRNTAYRQKMKNVITPLSKEDREHAITKKQLEALRKTGTIPDDINTISKEAANLIKLGLEVCAPVQIPRATTPQDLREDTEALALHVQGESSKKPHSHSLSCVPAKEPLGDPFYELYKHEDENAQIITS